MVNVCTLDCFIWSLTEHNANAKKSTWHYFNGVLSTTTKSRLQAQLVSAHRLEGYRMYCYMLAVIPKQIKVQACFAVCFQYIDQDHNRLKTQNLYDENGKIMN
jgi:hypothetical protein